MAHKDGLVPNILLEIPELDAYTFGYLVYFFEKACAMSAYMIGVNPFNRPGVETIRKICLPYLVKDTKIY